MSSPFTVGGGVLTTTPTSAETREPQLTEETGLRSRWPREDPWVSGHARVRASPATCAGRTGEECSEPCRQMRELRCSELLGP